MAKRIPILAAGLVLVMAALGPAGAAASAGGTNLPMNGTGTGHTAIDQLTGATSGDSTGVATHFGQFTAHLDGQAAGTTFTGTGNLVAADGDQITDTISATITPTSPTSIDVVGTLTITGGTGRFEDASGSAEFIDHNSLDSVVGTTALTSDHFTIKGQISY